ncbi:MAG: hypothetical protein WD396_08555 [Pseudohongiellaceae bacterium]
MRALNHTLRLGTASLLAMVLGSYVFASTAEASGPENLSRVNGSVEVGAGENRGRVSTVNGSIVIDRDASAEEVETVNGRIELRRGSRVTEAGTVNGRIRVEEEVQVAGDLGTVNGDIRVHNGSHIAGHVRTVNGKISLHSAQVGDYVRTANGDIELRGSVVEGDIIFKGSRSWLGRLFSFGGDRRPDLVIDAGSVVRGTIYLHREVDLRIHEDAQVGEIVHSY